MEPVVRIRSVGKTFIDGARTPVLHGVNFELGDGEFVCIVGESGCGKTTLLNIITGIEEPTEGSVEFRDGVNARMMLGYATQRPMLLEFRTALQNATLDLELHGRLSEERLKEIQEMFARHGLDGFQDHYALAISGGMRQKVALIRTLSTDPPLLVLDEPFSAIDYRTRLQLAQEIRGLVKQNNKACLFVTHSIEEAIAVGDQIIVLGGRPATIIGQVNVPVSEEDRQPLVLRTTEGFRLAFQQVWKALDVSKNTNWV